MISALALVAIVAVVVVLAAGWIAHHLITHTIEDDAPQ